MDLRLRSSGVEWKPEMKCRSDTRLAFNPDLLFVSIHHFHHVFGAESSAPFMVLTALVEKRRSRISWRYPVPGVCHYEEPVCRLSKIER
jgi:hypothetical protein